MKITDLHIRPSNAKYGGKNKLIAFIMVNDYLLSFTDGKTYSDLPLKFVTECYDIKLTKLSDSSFIFREIAKKENG
jgi:hypothetical protein